MLNLKKALKNSVIFALCLGISLESICLQSNKNSVSIIASADETDDDSDEYEIIQDDIEERKRKSDHNWVDIKDDWRHGIYHSSDSDSTLGGATAKGHATGDYAIEYKDGRYYWYHQSTSCGTCTYCGDWSLMLWGSGTSWDVFANYGCEVYAAAAIVSNLLGEPITPRRFLEDEGCTITDNSGGVKCDTSTQDYGVFSTYLLTSGTEMSSYITDKYGLESTGSIKINSGGNSASAKQIVDDCLDNGGMIWYVHSMISANHYVAIRYHDSSGYYLLDSCCAPGSSNFDHAFSWDEIWNSKKAEWDYMYGFWNPNPPTGSGEGNTGDGSAPTAMSNQGWQRDHSQDGRVTSGMSGVDRLNCAHLGGPASKYGCELTQSGNGGGLGNSGDIYEYSISDADKQTLERFARENFTSGMSAGEKVETTLMWIYDNVTYADGRNGVTYDSISGKTNVDAIFNQKAGQCLQYNGALTAMMCYLGFDAKLVMGYRGRSTSDKWQHFWCEVKIGNEIYVMETGNRGCDEGWYYVCLTYPETHTGSTAYIKYNELMV